MSRPTGTDRGRLEDLWRGGPGSGTATTQPIPVIPFGDEPGDHLGPYRPQARGDGPPGTPPDGNPRPRDRPAGRSARRRPAQDRSPRRRFGPLPVELLLAVLTSVLVAAGTGWRVLRDLRSVVPGEDPFAGLWSLAWSGHALWPGSGVAPTRLFDGNAFHPADHSLALTDSLLGYGPLTWFFPGPTGLVTTYDLILVLTPALASLGAYALARQFGAHPVGAAVAGAGFAYAPWHENEFAHLSALSTGPMVIALALLARGHGLTMSGRRSPSRPFWAVLGWLVAAWQLTIGFTVGLGFAYLLALVGVLVLVIVPVRALGARHRRRRAAAAAGPYPDVAAFSASQPAGPPEPPRRTGRLVLVDLAGATGFALVGLVMAYPYLRVDAIDPQAVQASRGLDQVLRHSPEPLGLISPPAVDGTWSWLTGGPVLVSGPDELRLLPGAILLALALIGLLVSSWRWWWRVSLLGAVVAIAGLSLGRRLPDAFFPGPDAPFVLLWRHVPGWAGDRTPGRLITFVTLALALLAAGAVSRLCGREEPAGRSRGSRLRVLVLALLPVLMVLEGWARIPVTPVPPPPTALSRAPGPTVVLPSVPANDSRVMFWSAVLGFPEVANGTSSITPTPLTRMRTELAGFPDARSVNYLRQNGFRSVVVLRDLPGTDLWADADRVPDPALGLVRWDLGESVLFSLGPL